MPINFPDNPTDNQEFNGYIYDATRGVWDVKLASDPLGSINLTTPAQGEALVFDGTNWVNQELQITSTIQDLTDTAISSPSEGDTMVYDGSSWINTPATSGNAIINGDFGIWQRGTSFSSSGYTADRWSVQTGGYTISTTQQTFSPGEVPVSGYGESEHYVRLSYTGTGTSTGRLEQLVEDVRTFAGQTVTLSFWVKASQVTGTSCNIFRNYGSGGSAIDSGVSQNYDISTSWQRITKTFDLSDMSGKTIGDGSFLYVQVIREGSGTRQDGVSIDIWGVQLEAGSVATPFRLAGGGSKAAELALCQRYYQKYTSVTVWPATSGGQTYFYGPFALSSSMRASPSASIYNPSNNNQNVIRNWNGTEYTVSAILKNQNQFIGVQLPSNVDVGESICTAAVILESEL